MAATTWVPKPALNQHWLLTNGKTVSDPPLEETSTGRKVRVAGTATSVYSSDDHDLVWAHVESIAKRQRAKVWMPVSRSGVPSGVTVPSNRLPKAHWLDGRKTWEGRTELWWHFRHPSLPIDAVVKLHIWGSAGYSQSGRQSTQSIMGFIEAPLTNPIEARFGAQSTWYDEGDLHSEYSSKIYESEEVAAHREFVRREPPDWGINDALSESIRFPTVQVAAAEFLKRIRIIEEIDTLRVPDLRDPLKPTYMALKLVDTNVTADLVEALRDFLDTGPAMDRAVAAYKEMRAALRELGMVLEDQSQDTLLAALQQGGEALSVTCGNPADVDSELDLKHTLTLRLATGTFAVSCSQRQHTNRNEIATKWDEAQTMASITGQEDELLAYARAYAARADDTRVSTILDQHNPNPNVRGGHA